MEMRYITHCIDNILTQAEARMDLCGVPLVVTWFTNQANEQSVVHSHPYHELVLPIGGSTVRYSVNGSVYLVQVGELIYFPAQIYHSGKFNITAPVSERLVVQIDDALWQAARRSAGLMGTEWQHDVTVLDEQAGRQWNFRGLFERMAQTAQVSGAAQRLIFEAQVMELLLLIAQVTGSGQTSAPNSTSALVGRAVAYLQAHYQEPALTSARLAQELYTSREHLSRAFKECTMESIHGYLTHLRMQHCRQALAAGAPVLSACTESGFPDYSSFLKTFRRMYGMTPAAYRTQYRAAAS